MMTKTKAGSHNLSRRLFIVGCLCVILASGQFLLLRPLSHKSSQFETVTKTQLVAAPTPDFQLGSIKWNVKEYAASPKLKPFRDYFQKHCADKVGVVAGACVSNAFATDFDFGDDRYQFFEKNYIPTKDFESHVRHHEVGHCVSRSSLLATVLLSVGIPTRVVQLAPKEIGDFDDGHNVAEVWDHRLGWVLIDPSYGGFLGKGTHHRLLSASGALENRSNLNWLFGERSPVLTISPKTHYQVFPPYYKPDSIALKGDLLFPEPWLYMRVGNSSSSWPFRAKFAHFINGKASLWLGPAQTYLRIGIIICIIFSIACFGICLYSALRRLRGSNNSRS